MANRLRNGRRAKPGKIHEALYLLNEAARDKQQELYDALGHRYQDIQHLFEDYTSQGRERMEEVRQRADEALRQQEERLRETTDEIREKAHEVDEKVHQNPWPVIGGVAFGSFLLGALIRRSRSRKRDK